MTDPREAATKWYTRISAETRKKLNEKSPPGTSRDLSETEKVLLAQICLAIGDLDARDASKTERMDRLEARSAKLERATTRYDSE